jgi:hypothetical protein
MFVHSAFIRTLPVRLLPTADAEMCQNRLGVQLRIPPCIKERREHACPGCQDGRQIWLPAPSFGPALCARQLPFFGP